MNAEFDNRHLSLHAGSEASDVSLLTQIRELTVYKWQILGMGVLAALIAVVVVFSMEPTYRATAALLIEPKQNNALNIDEIYDPGAGSREYYATQYEILRSRELAERVVVHIDWEKYDALVFAEKSERQDDWLRRLPLLGSIMDRFDEWLALLPLGNAPLAATEAGADDGKVLARIGYIMANTEIQPVPGTQLVKINFLSQDRELARLGASLLARAYIDSGLDVRLETTEQATGWIGERIDTVRARLEAAERALQSFRERNDLVNIGGGRKVQEDALADTMQRLREAGRTMTELDNTYKRILSAGRDIGLLQEIPMLFDSELVRATKTSYLKASESVEELRSRYGPKHPKMIQALARLREAESAYHKQLLDAVDGVRSRYQVASANVASLSGQADQARDEIRGIDRKQYEHEVLQRELDTSRQLYQTMLTRYQESDVAGDFEMRRARIVDPAVLPTKPYSPNKKRSIMLATFGGLVLGVVLAMIRRRLDDAIKIPEEMESLGLAPLAAVPILGGGKKGKKMARYSIDNPKSPFAEAIRSLRTSIVLSELDEKHKRILITSTVPREGKSVIATNLALTLGHSHTENVLLMDLDLRRPSLAPYFGGDSRTPGVTEVLAGECELKAVLQRVGEGVWLLPSGRVPPNPVELIESRQFKALIDQLAEKFDRLIIDSPPCQPASDARLLARHMDAVIFVVRHDSTRPQFAQQAVKQLRLSRTKVLGGVLSQVNLRRSRMYDSSYFHHETYYGQ